MKCVLSIGSIVLRVDDLQRQAEFWEAALDYVRRDDGTSDDFVLLGPKDGVGPSLSLDNVPSQVQIPPRLHLDLYTQDQPGEVERLKRLGATEVDWDKRPPDADPRCSSLARLCVSLTRRLWRPAARSYVRRLVADDGASREPLSWIL